MSHPRFLQRPLGNGFRREAALGRRTVELFVTCNVELGFWELDLALDGGRLERRRVPLGGPVGEEAEDLWRTARSA